MRTRRDTAGLIPSAKEKKFIAMMKILIRIKRMLIVKRMKEILSYLKKIRMTLLLME